VIKDVIEISVVEQSATAIGALCSKDITASGVFAQRRY
jgi:hypothetical protein